MSGARSRVSAMIAVGAAAIALGVFVATSCSNSPPAKSPVLEKQRTPSLKTPDTTEKADPESKPVAKSYADAIRRRDFERAIELIDAATETERKAPEVRYARALAALETGDIETTLRLSDELEKEGGLFVREAQDLRSRAAQISNDITLLAHFLGGSQSPDDQLLLAEAHEASSSIREARKIAENVLVTLQKAKRTDRLQLEARARRIKARTLVAEDMKREAALEYHWLATDGCALDDAGEYAEKVEVFDPTLALNQKERMQRIEAFSKKGLVSQTEAEIEALRRLAPAAGAPSKVDHHLAWAVYNSRSDYLRAAQLFANAAAHGGPDKREYLYYEAKSLARSHRDQEAIGKYEKVAALGGVFSDHASYQAARLRFIDGQWKAAVGAYESYLKRYGARAKHHEGALTDLPIARLAADDFDKAFQELTILLKKESSQRERARLMELRGVAKLGAGKTAEAEALFREVIEYRPLSLPALMAAARLRSMNKAPPPAIAPPRSLTESQKAALPLELSLPEKVWRLSRVGLDEEAEETLRSSESALRSQFGERSNEALCRLYGQLESAKRRYQIAQTAASWSVLKESPNAATEWQWDCIYPTPYRAIVEVEGARRDVPPSLIYAVMRQESAFRPTVVSPAAAVGLMQIIPPTAKKIAQSLNIPFEADLMRAPAVNISFGAYYLHYLMDIFQGRPELVAASYNAGPQAVSRWLRAGSDLPLDIFVARIPYSETRNYVYRVMNNYARYAYRDEKTEPLQVDLALPKGIQVPEDAY